MLIRAMLCSSPQRCPLCQEGYKEGSGALSTAGAFSQLCPLLSFHRSRDGSPRSSEGQSPLYMHSSKCSSCGCQSPQHTEMCLHTPGSNFGEEMGETQSEYSDSSCGESCILGRLFQPAAGGLCNVGTHHCVPYDQTHSQTCPRCWWIPQCFTAPS